MKRNVLLILFCFTTFLCISQNFIDKKTNPALDNSKNKITYKIINAPNKTFGYDIFMDGKAFIHQANKPGCAGNEGFKNASSAQKTAELVVQKISEGQIPPTITIEELKAIKAE